MAELGGIYNFLLLSPLVATAGQPTEDEFAAVKAAGFKAVVNLLPTSSPYALPEEGRIISGLGLDYVHIPVEWENPTAADAERFFDVMAVCADRRVFVHCAANMRVSAFLYLYRTLRQHVPPAQAAEDLHRIWAPNETWQRFIDGFNQQEDEQHEAR